MKRNLRFTLSILMFMSLIVSRPSYAANLDNGQAIFSANCSPCHTGGNNVIEPEKTLKIDALELNNMKSVDAIMTQVTNGKNGMPAFGGRLTSDDIGDVASYVLSQAEQGW